MRRQRRRAAPFFKPEKKKGSQLADDDFLFASKRKTKRGSSLFFFFFSLPAALCLSLSLHFAAGAAAPPTHGFPCASTGCSSLRSCGVDQGWSRTIAHSTGRPKFFWGRRFFFMAFFFYEREREEASKEREKKKNKLPEKKGKNSLSFPLSHLEPIGEDPLCLLKLGRREGEPGVLVAAEGLELS